MELAKNIELLVDPQPTLREDSPSPTVDQEKIQCNDGSAKAPEAHAPGIITGTMNVCLSYICPAAELL